VDKKILIVDDSSLIRKHLVKLFESNSYECDTAKNGQEAIKKIDEFDYDAITMDINMPVMDGLEAIAQIMKSNPTPILVVSSITTEGANETLEALELGAIDYVTKPGQYRIDVDNDGAEILEKLHAISNISKRRLKLMMKDKSDNIKLKKTKRVKTSIESNKNTSEDELLNKSSSVKKIVLIGSSTGGPGLIERICTSLPKNFPHPVCIVQHMPEQFTTSFATRINKLSKVIVKESEHGEELRNGVVYIAKGGIHMHFRKKVSGKLVIKHSGSTTQRFFTPSVDELYLSATDIFAPDEIFPVLLTGIGDDGAEGMVSMKKNGTYTVGESEDSATVYGMPRVAYENGGISEQMNFDKILQYIVSIRE